MTRKQLKVLNPQRVSRHEFIFSNLIKGKKRKSNLSSAESEVLVADIGKQRSSATYRTL